MTKELNVDEKLNSLRKFIEKKGYTLETLLLCTPYEDDSDRNLSGNFNEDIFFNYNFYAEMNITKHINLIDMEILEKKGNYNEESILNNKKNELIIKRDNVELFKNNIYNCNFSKDISYIRAFPGSGKTTFLHKILFDNRDTHKSIVIDLKKYVSSMKISSFDYKDNLLKGFNYDTKNTLVKFLFVVFNSFNDLIKKNKINSNDRNNIHISYIENIKNNYFTLFNENDELLDIKEIYGKLFKIMHEYTENKNYSLFIKYVKDYFSSLFDETYKKNKKTSIRECIIIMLRLIMIFLLCDNEIEEIKNRRYKCIIAFDNIEYFIEKDAVFDEDIIEIESIIQDVLKDADEFFMNAIIGEQESVFLGRFKFIMTIRDSTNFLKGPKQNDDKNINVIDITDLYDLDDIHETRFNAFNSLNLLTDEEKNIYGLIQKTIKDISPYKNSSGVTVEEMFNHNKRRMTTYLYQVLKQENKRNNYETLLNLIKEKDEEDSKEEISILKNGSRNYILRLLLDNIQNTNYFSELMTMGDYEGELGKSYARRILTYLHYRKLYNNNQYVSFYDLLHHVFDRPSDINNDTINEFFANKIANIILKLNDPEKDQTKWCQLVIIKFGQHQMSRELLRELLISEYKTDTNNGEYGIKITEAGSYYLSILPRFEYFACRYFPNSKPLFDPDSFIINCRQKNISYKNFNCFEFIDKVKKQTIGYYRGANNFINGCVQEIFDTDNKFFSSKAGLNYKVMYEKNYLYKYDRNTIGYSQVRNILVSHIGYLDSFRGYVSFYDKNIISDNNKFILLKYLLDVIKEYLDVLKKYSEVKDNFNTYYIDNYNFKQDKRMITILCEQLSNNLIEEINKLSNKKIEYKSIFTKNESEDI